MGFLEKRKTEKIVARRSFRTSLPVNRIGPILESLEAKEHEQHRLANEAAMRGERGRIAKRLAEPIASGRVTYPQIYLTLTEHEHKWLVSYPNIPAKAVRAPNRRQHILISMVSVVRGWVALIEATQSGTMTEVSVEVVKWAARDDRMVDTKEYEEFVSKLHSAISS
jgi:hypothetical protein